MLVFHDPYPETVGLGSLTIYAPADFRGDARIVWQLQTSNEERQLKCNAHALLQGVFRDVRGTRPETLFDARVVALVLHAFYRARIEEAARLEACYEWRVYTDVSSTTQGPR
jgi:hypothetical protein